MEGADNLVLEQVEAVIAKFDDVIALLVAKRDPYNRAIALARATKDRLRRQMEAVKFVGSQNFSEEIFATFASATSVLEKLAEALSEEILGIPMSDVPVSPPPPEKTVSARPKRQRRARRVNAKAAGARPTSIPKPKKPAGIYPMVDRIIRASFAGEVFPITLMEAVEGTWKSAWVDQQIPLYGIHKGKTIGLGEDLQAGSNSLLAKRIATALIVLREANSPGSTLPVSKQVMDLNRKIHAAERWSTIEETIRGWIQ